jgi:CheY-like chemotaxis protein/CRP-like cAMP-binding protein
MKKILVVEDNTQIRENTAEILDLAGYETYEAENGKKAVETAIKQKPDLIVCDIMMPELDGYGVLHLLKKNPDTEHIPFIFLTARAERADFRKGMEMGADDYISKPFDDIELLKAIEMRLKKIDIIKMQYPSGEKGASELIKDLKGSGFLALDPDMYDSERLNKKMSLYKEGKRPKFLFVVKSGKIKTYRVNDDGKEYITNIYTSGDFVGHAVLLEDSNYDDSAEVLEEAEIVAIPKEDFLQAIFNDLHITTKFIKLISRDVKEKEERLLHLAYDTLRKRVAKALVDIHQKFNKGNQTQVNIAISRDDIAQYIGTATESLIRTLSDFKSEKLIEIKDGKIIILQLEKLANLLY